MHALICNPALDLKQRTSSMGCQQLSNMISSATGGNFVCRGQDPLHNEHIAEMMLHAALLCIAWPCIAQSTPSINWLHASILNKILLAFFSLSGQWRAAGRLEWRHQMSFMISNPVL